MGAESLSAFLQALSGENSPTQPLYFIVEYGWAKIFGPGYEAQRWLSVLLGEISLMIVYAIGHRLQGTTTGFLTALALASSSVHIEYSLGIRMYMLMFVWAMISIYSLLRILGGDGKVWWGIHFTSTIALVWTHAFGVFLLPAEAIACLVLGPRTWKWQIRWFGGQFIAIWIAPDLVNAI